MVMMHVCTVHTLLMATWQRANCTDVCGYLFCIDVSKLTVHWQGSQEFGSVNCGVKVFRVFLKRSRRMAEHNRSFPCSNALTFLLRWTRPHPAKFYANMLNMQGSKHAVILQSKKLQNHPLFHTEKYLSGSKFGPSRVCAALALRSIQGQYYTYTPELTRHRPKQYIVWDSAKLLWTWTRIVITVQTILALSCICCLCSWTWFFLNHLTYQYNPIVCCIA